MRTGSPRAWRARATALVAASCASIACAGAEGLDPIAAVAGPAGELHLFARRAGINGAGEAGGPVSFRFAEQRDGSWHSATLWQDAFGPTRYGAPLYRLLLGPGDRQTLVVDAGDVRLLTRSPGGAWEPIPIDPALPEEAVDALGYGRALGGAWIGSDGELRVLVNGWLLETEDGMVSRATSVGETCDPFTTTFSECHFLPTGDRTGDAVIFDAAFGRGDLRLRRLDCTVEPCVSTEINDHGLGEPGGLGNSWEDRIALHLTDGTPYVVHRPGLAVRVAGDGREHRIGGEIYRYGAAPRPTGGLVVVTSAYYSDELVLHRLDEDALDPTALERTTIALPTIPLQGSVRLTVLVPPAADRSAERAHVLLGHTASTIVHLTVDLETGVTTREQLAL